MMSILGQPFENSRWKGGTLVAWGLSILIVLPLSAVAQGWSGDDDDDDDKPIPNMIVTAPRPFAFYSMPWPLGFLGGGSSSVELGVPEAPDDTRPGEDEQESPTAEEIIEELTEEEKSRLCAAALAARSDAHNMAVSGIAISAGGLALTATVVGSPEGVVITFVGGGLALGGAIFYRMADSEVEAYCN